MARREFFVVALLLHILIIQYSDARLYNHERTDDDDSDEAYYLLKRLLFSNSDPGSTQQPPSILHSPVHPGSTEKSTVSSQRSTHSPSTSACVSHACEHGGICIPTGQVTYECRCVGPWRGIYCGIADACYRLPCQNGGTCRNVHDDYWCQCPSDYYGTNCQSKYYSSSDSASQCGPSICNTGRCVSLQTTYYCQCPDDRYGEHCEYHFYKRDVASYQSYRKRLHQLKRNMLRGDNQ